MSTVAFSCRWRSRNPRVNAEAEAPDLRVINVAPCLKVFNPCPSRCRTSRAGSAPVKSSSYDDRVLVVLVEHPGSEFFKGGLFFRRVLGDCGRSGECGGGCESATEGQDVFQHGRVGCGGFVSIAAQTSLLMSTNRWRPGAVIETSDKCDSCGVVSNEDLPWQRELLASLWLPLGLSPPHSCPWIAIPSASVSTSPKIPPSLPTKALPRRIIFSLLACVARPHSSRGGSHHQGLQHDGGEPPCRNFPGLARDGQER